MIGMAKTSGWSQPIWPIIDPYGDAVRRTYERYTGYRAEPVEVAKMAKTKPKPGKPKPGC